MIGQRLGLSALRLLKTASPQWWYPQILAISSGLDEMVSKGGTGEKMVIFSKALHFKFKSNSIV